MNVRDLRLRIRALILPRRVERELDEELAFHIEREVQKHIAAGLSPVEARRLARSRFGSVSLAADQCRDARGTAPVDALARDVIYAWRMFRRAPLVALTIVSTVAVGLGLVAVVFTFYNAFFLRVDAVRRPAELFAVERSTGPGDDDALRFTWADYDAMRRETSVFTDVVAMQRLVRARVDGRVVLASFVSGNFFQVLDVQARLGRTLIPDADERFAARPAIVLSHLGWQKLFAADPMVIGRSVTINGAEHQIVGVMADGFRGLGILPPDFWMPLELAGRFRSDYTGRGDQLPIEIVGRLKPEMSAAAAGAALTVWASARPDTRAVRGQPQTITLQPSTGTLAVDTVVSLMAFAPIFLVFGLILMIGCANVANLLLARGVSRQREIAVRLSLGASRPRIVMQLLTENLLLALVAAAGGLVIGRLFLEGVLRAVTLTVPPELLEVDPMRFVAPATDWRILTFLVAGAIVSTAVFGLAPALQATRVALVPAMRGEVMGSARPRRARHTLIALQVGASALLLISAAIFFRGSFGVTTNGPALRTADTVRVSIANEPRRTALLQTLRNHPLVVTVAASSQPESDFAATALSAGAPREPVSQLAVSADYFDVLGFEVVSGRGFTQAERTADTGIAVVSERIARRLWPNGDGVGQTVRVEAQHPDSPVDASPRTLTVVGVVRDPARDGGMSYLDTFRGVYVPAGPESPGTWLMLRVRGNPEQARQVLLERLMSVDPGLGGIVTLQTLAGMQTYVLKAAFSVTVVLGGLALLLTVSGLFSVLSYVVEQQAKEIGVRMALGAATTNVVWLVLSQSLRPVSSGLAVAGGLAVAVAIVLTATATELRGWMHLLDPVAYLASLLVIVTSCVMAVSVPALRAARIDPIATLRKD
jgi:predicted permease